MKNVLKLSAAAALALALNSCGATMDNYGYGSNYPNAPYPNQYPSSYPNTYPNQYPSSYPNTYPNQYPGNNTTIIVYKTPDGGSYRTGEIYRDRRGNVYQDGRVIRTVNVYENPGVIERVNGNNRNYRDQNRRNLPPGQAKKIYGGNAKDYAPGQQKKWKDGDHDKNWRDRKDNNNNQ